MQSKYEIVMNYVVIGCLCKTDNIKFQKKEEK